MTSTEPTVELVAVAPQLRNVETPHIDQTSTWQAEGILMEVLGCRSDEAAKLVRMASLADRRDAIRAAFASTDDDLVA